MSVSNKAKNVEKIPKIIQKVENFKVMIWKNIPQKKFRGQLQHFQLFSGSVGLKINET